MVCTINDLSAWKDFPKGLRVLLLDSDSNFAYEMKSKLETMDYIVSLFSNANDALSAISSTPESFHVAIVEVNSSNDDMCFKFLETTKGLPTIMISNIHCLSTMMKCIALGAVEFLQKPLSEDKLRNIWQHVVHKAFNAGGTVLSESLKPVQDSVASILQFNVESEDTNINNIRESQNGPITDYNENEESPPSDKYPAPSTPQLNQGVRLVDDGDCQEHTNCSTEKDSGEQEDESKSAETTCALVESVHAVSHPQSFSDTLIREKDDSTNCVKNESDIWLSPQIKDNHNNSEFVSETQSKTSVLQKSGVLKANKKKMKVDWTPELHKKFVQAVERLGLDQAIPSRILEVMKVDGLTRHNVASHLQKYRIHQRHILPKEDDGNWMQQRDQMHRIYYPYKSIMACPPCQSNNPISPTPIYPLWGTNSNQPAGVPIWAPPCYLPWTTAESWHWKTYPGMCADAWGCPVMLPPHNYSSFPQSVSGFHCAKMAENVPAVLQNSFNSLPADEVIDKVVKEAISKPWLPLPLGLRPPSTDGVLSELSRQGIITPLPHNKNHSKSC